jgi:ribosome assembly protein YihI (activator of Der GTPase)
MISFLKNQWLGSILIILFILFIFYEIGKNDELKKEKQRLEKEIETLEKKEQLHWKALDSLKSHKDIIIEKQKTLIKLEHDTIKVIDTIAFSKLQRFFTDRYYKKDSIR